jgi:urease accessory protein
MKRDAAKMRDAGPTIFTSVKHGQGVEDVIDLILTARRQAGAEGHGKSISEFQ